MNSIRGVPSFSFLLCFFFVVFTSPTRSWTLRPFLQSPFIQYRVLFQNIIVIYIQRIFMDHVLVSQRYLGTTVRNHLVNKTHVEKKKDLKTGIRSYARWHEIEIIMVQIRKHPLRDLNLLAALNTFFFPDEKVSLSLWHTVSKLRIKDCCWFRLMFLASIGLTSQY